MFNQLGESEERVLLLVFPGLFSREGRFELPRSWQNAFFRVSLLSESSFHSFCLDRFCFYRHACLGTAAHARAGARQIRIRTDCDSLRRSRYTPGGASFAARNTSTRHRLEDRDSAL